jgi:hypothetical protein
MLMRSVLVTLSLAALLTSIGTAQDEESPGPEEFSAVALSNGGPLSNAVAAPLEIDIERWSTAAERTRLVAAIGKGQKAMLEVLYDLPRIGAIRTPGDLGLTLHYAHQTRTDDGGRRIFLATDRPIGFAETWNRSRTADYPFTFIELNVPARGDGKGLLSLATKVTASRDGRFVHAENWDSAITLTQVKRRR